MATSYPTQATLLIIESVDSIIIIIIINIRDGPTLPLYVIHCKKPNNSAQITFHAF